MRSRSREGPTISRLIRASTSVILDREAGGEAEMADAQKDDRADARKEDLKAVYQQVCDSYRAIDESRTKLFPRSAARRLHSPRILALSWGNR